MSKVLEWWKYVVEIYIYILVICKVVIFWKRIIYVVENFLLCLSFNDVCIFYYFRYNWLLFYVVSFV